MKKNIPLVLLFLLISVSAVADNPFHDDPIEDANQCGQIYPPGPADNCRVGDPSPSDAYLQGAPGTWQSCSTSKLQAPGFAWTGSLSCGREAGISWCDARMYCWYDSDCNGTLDFQTIVFGGVFGNGNEIIVHPGEIIERTGRTLRFKKCPNFQWGGYCGARYSTSY